MIQKHMEKNMKKNIKNSMGKSMKKKNQRVEACYEGVCRPGGFSITERAMAFCSFKTGAKLLDVGCGLGGTVCFLRERYGLNLYGIDQDRDALKQGRELLKNSELWTSFEQGNKTIGVDEILLEGDSENLPYEDGELDGIIFECSFSKMERENHVLEEAFRVLKPAGYLIITDFFSKGTPGVLTGLLGRIDSKEQLLDKIEKGLFSICLFEDHSMKLKTMLGQMVFDYGCEALYESLSASPEKMKRIKPGYCLIVAKKL